MFLNQVSEEFSPKKKINKKLKVTICRLFFIGDAWLIVSVCVDNIFLFMRIINDILWKMEFYFYNLLFSI